MTTNPFDKLIAEARAREERERADKERQANERAEAEKKRRDEILQQQTCKAIKVPACSSSAKPRPAPASSEKNRMTQSIEAASRGASTSPCISRLTHESVVSAKAWLIVSLFFRAGVFSTVSSM